MMQLSMLHVQISRVNSSRCHGVLFPRVLVEPSNPLTPVIVLTLGKILKFWSPSVGVRTSVVGVWPKP